MSRLMGYNYADDIPRGKNMLSEHDFDEIDRSVDSLENRIRQLEAENARIEGRLPSTHAYDWKYSQKKPIPE